MARTVTYDFAGVISGDEPSEPLTPIPRPGDPTLLPSRDHIHSPGPGDPSLATHLPRVASCRQQSQQCDTMEVGVCFGNGCNHGHIDDNPEIDTSGREAVRLDITRLISNFQLVHYWREFCHGRRATRHFRR
jgi:hypothetical protein